MSSVDVGAKVAIIVAAGTMGLGLTTSSIRRGNLTERRLRVGKGDDPGRGLTTHISIGVPQIMVRGYDGDSGLQLFSEAHLTSRLVSFNSKAKTFQRTKAKVLLKHNERL